MHRTRTFIASLFALAAIFIAVPTAAWAGSPHFIKSATTVSVSGNTLTVSGKEAGLGDVPTVHLSLTADALCINGGGHHPKAVNKTGVATDGQFPVFNGKVDFTLDGTATFTPSCSPPMTVSFTNIKVTDTTNDITLYIPGTFP